MRATLPLLLVLSAAVGCQSKKSEAIVAAPTSGATPAPAAGQSITGKVLEKINASPYCYLRLQSERGEIWAAVPETNVEKGMEVTVANAMLMNNFESKSLNRTFAEIYFGVLAPAGGAVAAGAAAPAAPPRTGTPAPAPMEGGKVDKATGPDAQTIAEVWAKKGTLKEKSVSIRGRVVKYNPAVMGKNWIHLQDGSGDAAKGTHDITVTSQDTVAKGDVVTVKGVVRLDKDLGSGYSYAIIVEDAKVVKK